LRFAGSAISAVKRKCVGCDASPGPASGTRPAAELTDSRDRLCVSLMRASDALPDSVWKLQSTALSAERNLSRPLARTSRIKGIAASP